MYIFFVEHTKLTQNDLFENLQFFHRSINALNYSGLKIFYLYMAAPNNITRFRSRAHTLSKRTVSSAHTRPTRTPLVMAAASTSLSYGFAVEGTPSFEGHAFENTAAWLRSCPEGAYTTARTVDKRTLVFEYDAHLKRLVETLSKMEETDVDPETTVYAPEKLEPAVRACFAAAVNAAPLGDGDEGKVTVLCAHGKHAIDAGWCDDGGLAVRAVCERLPPRPAQPVRAVAFGAPRKNAAAKAVSWVRDREGLEKRKPADANEVVLVDDEGRLLEGLSSNFYALYDDGTLHTAPEGMVLGGTVRKVVLEVCEREGIEVVLEPPSVNDADRFVAAFVSSTSRLLLPLAKFDIDDKHLQFGDGDGGERARQLEKWVLDEVSRCSSSI